MISDSEHFDIYLPCELIIVSENYLLNTVKYRARMYGDFHYAVCDSSKPLVAETVRIVKEYFNNFPDVRKSRITATSDIIRFCGKILRLTATERRILNLFLFSDKCYSGDSVAAYCLTSQKSDPASATSHIGRINKKAKDLTGLPIIAGKRYEGYKLNMI